MKLLTLLFAGLALAVIPVARAGAADPLPVPCDGVLATDASGDQEIGPLIGGPPGGPTNTTAPDNMDITQVFLNTRNGVTTANIQVKNLSKDVPAEIRSGHFSYVLDFATNEGYSFVRAETDGEEVTFHAAVVQSAGPVSSANPLAEEDLKGRFLEGPDGIVEIELPAALSKPGLKLESVYAYVSMRSDDENYTGYINDQAPDDGATSAKSYTVTECPAPVAAETPTPAAAVEAPAAPPAAAPAPAAQSQPATQPAKKPAAKKKKLSCKQKAKKLKGKKRAKALKKCKKAAKRKKRR